MQGGSGKDSEKVDKSEDINKRKGVVRIMKTHIRFVRERTLTDSGAPAGKDMGPGRGILLFPVGIEYGLAVLAGGLATVCPSYFWAEVLLDTTGETSEIGWLTYPPGGVSATLILNLNPLSLPLPVP